MDYTQVLLVLGLLAINLVQSDKPMFNCDNEVESSLSDRDFNITCSVTSDPAVTGCRVFWYLNPGPPEAEEEPTELGDGEDYNHMSFSCMPSDDNDDEILTLEFDQMFPQHFRSYILEVTNDDGVAEHNVTVSGYSADDEPDSALNLLVSPLTLLLTTFLSMLLLKY